MRRALSPEVDAFHAQPRSGEARSPEPGTVREQLRRATAKYHAGMHAHRGFSSIVTGTLTLPEYRTLLARLYGFHFALERTLRSAPACRSGEIDVIAREKTHLLRADLADLGLSQDAIDATPLCACVPEVTSADEVFGCLYVIEGAGLGGRVLAQKLDYLLGDGGKKARRFFNGRPRPDPLPWRVLCQLLEAQARTGNGAAMARSARHTFRAMALWLREVPRHA